MFENSLNLNPARLPKTDYTALTLVKITLLAIVKLLQVLNNIDIS